MRTLGLIRRATPPPPHDLWPRVHARLRAQDEVVRLAFPGLGWREALALGVVLATLAAVSDPLTFLATAGIL